MKLTIKSGKVLLTEHSKLVDEFSFKNIDEDYDWQMCWLGQIKEDLFGLQYLGEAMKKSMDVALTQAYETPIDIGDAGHPPPDLRLKIADEYLKGESASSFETFEKVDEISGMARVIVDYLRPGFPRKEKDSSPLNPAIVKLVASFAQNAKALSDQAPQQPQGRKKLMKDPDIISAFKESQSKLKLATPIQKWNQIWIPNGFEQSDIDEMQSTELYDQQKAQRGLAYLQGIVFTNTDKNEDEGQPPKKPKPTQFPPQQRTKT